MYGIIAGFQSSIIEKHVACHVTHLLLPVVIITHALHYPSNDAIYSHGPISGQKFTCVNMAFFLFVIDSPCYAFVPEKRPKRRHVIRPYISIEPYIYFCE